MNEELQKRIGLRIAEARHKLGLTQEELAVLLNSDQATIGNYEKGRRTPHATDLPRFAEVLKVPIEYFFEEINSNQT